MLSVISVAAQMELEFDKEIDAILRKAQSGVATPVAVGHLDADTIAAFAGGALPEPAKLLYTGHFADCDRCRRQLSEVIVMNREADAAAASTIWPPVEKPVSATPWYAKLFRAPSFAVAMGSLVLVFSGVLGYMLFRQQGEMAANNAAISQATEPDAGHGPYYSSGEVTNSNAAANAAAPALNAANMALATAAPGAIASASNTATNTAPGAFGRTTSVEEKKADENSYVLDGVSAAKPAPPAGGAAPPAPVDQPKAALRDDDVVKSAESEAGKDEKEAPAARKKQEADRMDREVMPRSLSKVGPSRAGPLNNAQQQMNGSTYDMSVTRKVGGKTFANRNGAWYDAAYHNQPTTNVRRGSDEFKKLDGGLRGIANELYGVVVVVWKGKAYRIN